MRETRLVRASGAPHAEYLSVPLPLVREGRINFSGELFPRELGDTGTGAEAVPGAHLGAGGVMLRIAGEMTDGTITWMVVPKTLESRLVPRITRAADAAGRPKPRIVVGLPVAVSDDLAAAQETAATFFQIYGTLPNFRGALDFEGAGPAGVAIVGNQAEVERQLRALAAAGATEFLAGIIRWATTCSGRWGERGRC